MPVDVAMPATFHSENFLNQRPICFRDREEPAQLKSRFDPEAKAGYMTLISPSGRKQDVQVKIYRTSLEHFAVIYPQKKICKPLGFINLKNTTVSRLSDEKIPGLLIRQKDFDSIACLSFISEEPTELESWIAAFTSRASPTIMQSCLPVVEEDDEN